MLAAEWVGDGYHDDMAMLAITAPGGDAADRARWSQKG
jgi:hypothetical protein